MCADNAGSDLPWVDECPVCGGPVDVNGDSTEICCYSTEDECPECGGAPCDGGC